MSVPYYAICDIHSIGHRCIELSKQQTLQVLLSLKLEKAQCEIKIEPSGWALWCRGLGCSSDAHVLFKGMA